MLGLESRQVLQLEIEEHSIQEVEFKYVPFKQLKHNDRLLDEQLAHGY